MAGEGGSDTEWRHLLPIPGLDEDSIDPSRPIRVVVEVDSDLIDKAGVQHLTWLLATLLTRNTGAVIDTVGVRAADVPLVAGVDPGAPEGGPSLIDTLKATAEAFGPEAAPVVDASELEQADLVLQVGNCVTKRGLVADVLHVSASGWTGTVTPIAADLPLFDVTSENPFGPYVAACLAAGQAYMYARVRDHQLQAVSLNAWTLTQATTDLGAATAVDPGTPALELDHLLAGVGAVGSALLLALWAYRLASGTVKAVDGDSEGVDDTNLNRCVPFWFADRGRPKAEVVAERLSGHHGLVIEPTVGRAEFSMSARTNLISAVDTPEARQALQDKYPSSAVQASTSGLRIEVLRVDPTAATACLRCFNPPRVETSDSEIRAQVARMDAPAVAAHAAAIDTDPEAVREWARAGGCGRIGDALLRRLRPSDGGVAQFSVGFASVLAGILLAAQVIKDAVARAGDPRGILEDIPLSGAEARFLTNLLDPAHPLAGVRRYGRDSNCPACQGVRADLWRERWTG